MSDSVSSLMSFGRFRFVDEVFVVDGPCEKSEASKNSLFKNSLRTLTPTCPGRSRVTFHATLNS